MGTLWMSIILMSRAAHASANHATAKDARRHVLSGSGLLIRSVIAVIPTYPRSLSASPPPHAYTPTAVVSVARTPGGGNTQTTPDPGGGTSMSTEGRRGERKIQESASQDIRSISGELAATGGARYST